MPPPLELRRLYLQEWAHGIDYSAYDQDTDPPELKNTLMELDKKIRISFYEVNQLIPGVLTDQESVNLKTHIKLMLPLTNTTQANIMDEVKTRLNGVLNELIAGIPGEDNDWKRVFAITKLHTLIQRDGHSLLKHLTLVRLNQFLERT